MSLIELHIACTGCGNDIVLPEESGVTIECRSCGLKAIYNKQIKYDAYLKFNIVGDKQKIYKIPGDIIIGRNNKDFVTIRDPITENEEDIPIRIKEVSRQHSKISLTNKCEIREIDGKNYVIIYPQCEIENIRARNGTEVNGTRINDKFILEDGNKITLAPKCKQFVEIEYFTKRS